MRFKGAWIIGPPGTPPEPIPVKAIIGVVGPLGQKGRELDQPVCFLCLQDFIAQKGHEPQDPWVGHGETWFLWGTPALKARWQQQPGRRSSTAMVQVPGLHQKVEHYCYGNHHSMGWVRPWDGKATLLSTPKTCPAGCYCPQGPGCLPLPCVASHVLQGKRRGPRGQVKAASWDQRSRAHWKVLLPLDRLRDGAPGLARSGGILPTGGLPLAPQLPHGNTEWRKA